MIPTALALFLLASTSVAQAAPLESALPERVSREGLLDLVRYGELFFLPAHDTTPFHGLVATYTATPCRVVEQQLMDIEGYPKLWKSIEKVRVLSRTPTRVEYEFKVDVVFSPTIKGIAEHPASGVVLFHDTETGGRFWYQLEDAGNERCRVLYSMYQPKKSGFVKLIVAVEKAATDSGEIAAGLAALAGLAHHSTKSVTPPPLSSAGQRTWDQLAGRGTVVRITYRQGRSLVMTSKRRVARPAHEVVRAIRDRPRYERTIDAFKRAKRSARGMEYTIGYFGGRVSFDTAVSESGAVDDAGGLVITERVTGGDIDEGFWRWQVRAVEGGSEVELVFDIDLAPGSLIMRNFMRQDPAMAYAVPTQLTLRMMSVLVGGRSLPLP